MALSTFALVSIAELKDYLGLQGSTRDSALEGIVNRVSDEIENFIDRQIVSRGALTEYHTMRSDGDLLSRVDLRTLEWPLISVTSVNEDVQTPPSYGANTLLTAGVDYQVVAPLGIIRRLLSGTVYPWRVAHRAVKVVYTAGYASTATVPDRIKGVALRYAALCWDEVDKKRFGVSGGSDALGNFTRFQQAKLTDDMQDTLTTERRPIWWRSGERDV